MYSHNITNMDSMNGNLNSDMYMLPLSDADTLANIGVSTHTATTPTLTPTTLKNFEESMFGYSNNIPSAPHEHQHQAGFVPPIVNISHYTTSGVRETSMGSEDSVIDTDDNISQNGWFENTDQNSSNDSSVNFSNALNISDRSTSSRSKSSTSGRRPKSSDKVLTVEEEERRRVRRERNKQAAARCRKRRLDHTNNLIKETEGLTERQLALKNELQALEIQKQELQRILRTHKCNHTENIKLTYL